MQVGNVRVRPRVIEPKDPPQPLTNTSSSGRHDFRGRDDPHRLSIAAYSITAHARGPKPQLATQKEPARAKGKHIPYSAPDLVFELRGEDYEFLRTRLKIADSINRTGSSGLREPTQEDVKLLIAKILVLQPLETYDSIMRFLKEIARKGEQNSAVVCFKICPSKEIFFSADVGGRVSNMRIKSEEIKKFPPVIGGVADFHGDNFFHGFLFGKKYDTDRAVLIGCWHLADSVANGPAPGNGSQATADSVAVI